jgi:uncharacterized membrane protein YqiK
MPNPQEDELFHDQETEIVVKWITALPEEVVELAQVTQDQWHDLKKAIRQYAAKARTDELTKVSEHMNFDSNNKFLDVDLYVWIWQERFEELKS